MSQPVVKERCPGCGAPLASVVGKEWADLIAHLRSGTGHFHVEIEVENGVPVFSRRQPVIVEKFQPGRGGS